MKINNIQFKVVYPFIEIVTKLPNFTEIKFLICSYSQKRDFMSK